MKRMSALFQIGCAVGFFTTGAAAQTADKLHIDVVRLSDRVLIARPTGPQPTNTIAVATERGIVVVDPGISPALAEAKRRRIAEEFGRNDFLYAVDTHDHGDHTYGNQAFADLTIVGHRDVPSGMEANDQARERTRTQINAALPRLRERLAGMEAGSEAAESLGETIAFYEAVASGLGEGFRLTPPTETFADRESLDLGDDTLELVYFGKAHSDTDILVFFTREGLLATGDLFYPDNDLYIDSERVPFLSRWADNLDWILDPDTGVRTVVPGHEDPLPLEEVARIRDFVREQAPLFEGKSSAFFDFRDTFRKDGVEAGLRRMSELKEQPDRFYFLHPEFDSFVYRLMLDDHLGDAIPLFEKLAKLFPEKPNAFDSLGEAYFRADRKDEAKAAFQRCLELDPENRNARARLAELGG